MILIDRSGEERKVNPALIKDIPKVRPYVYNACDGLLLDNLKADIPNHENTESTTAENLNAINKVLPFLFADITNVDIVMIRQAFVWYWGRHELYTKVPAKVESEFEFHEKVSIMMRLSQEIEERLLQMTKIEDTTSEEYKDRMAEIKGIQMLGKHLGIWQESDNMINTLTVGTTITDRNGKEFKGYSYLWNEHNDAMELLAKIDTVNIGNNTDEESAEALMEIIYRTFDRRVPKEELVESLDVEFISKAIRVYYDVE